MDSLAWRYYEGLFDEPRYRELMANSKDDEVAFDDDDGIELSKLKSYRVGIKWLGSDNSMLSFFCAVAQFDDSGRKDRVDSACAKIISDFNNQEVDPLGIVKYEEVKLGIDPRKSNVGQATRKLLLNGFKEYIREEGVINMSDCWPQAAD